MPRPDFPKTIFEFQRQFPTEEPQLVGAMVVQTPSHPLAGSNPYPSIPFYAYRVDSQSY